MSFMEAHQQDELACSWVKGKQEIDIASKSHVSSWSVSPGTVSDVSSSQPPQYGCIARKEMGYRSREALALLLYPWCFPTVGSLSSLADVAQTQFLGSFGHLWKLFGSINGTEIIVPVEERCAPSIFCKLYLIAKRTQMRNTCHSPNSMNLIST